MRPAIEVGIRVVIQTVGVSMALRDEVVLSALWTVGLRTLQRVRDPAVDFEVALRVDLAWKIVGTAVVWKDFDIVAGIGAAWEAHAIPVGIETENLYLCLDRHLYEVGYLGRAVELRVLWTVGLEAFGRVRELVLWVVVVMVSLQFCCRWSEEVYPAHGILCEGFEAVWEAVLERVLEGFFSVQALAACVAGFARDRESDCLVVLESLGVQRRLPPAVRDFAIVLTTCRRVPFYTKLMEERWRKSHNGMIVTITGRERAQVGS